MTLRPGERLVIDASIAVKWVVPQPDSDRAEALLDHPLVAPDLLFAECANVLWKKVRRGERSKDEADIAAQTLGQADIAIASTWGHLTPAMAIAVELDHSAYEAVYLSVARAAELRFVTVDDRLIRKVREGRSRVRHMLVALSEIA